MRKEIETHILSALRSLNCSDLVAINVSKTKSPEHGDYSSNVALMLARHLERPPMKIAREIKELIDHQGITRIDVASPGFLNFFTTEDYSNTIQAIIDSSPSFFSPDIGGNEQIYLEYVSSNPTGPLHVGHGRSAAYGSSLANILKQTGFNVHTEYYVNDAGLQIDILTSSLWLRTLNMTPPAGCYSGHYLEDLAGKTNWKFDKPQALESLLKTWSEEKSQENSQQLIQMCQDQLGEDYESVKKWVVEEITEHIKQDLKRFGVTYDNWFFESSLVESNAVESMLETLKKKGYTYEKDGAIWFKSSNLGDEKDRVIKRSNGIWTYFATDLAYHHHKAQQNPWKIIDVFGADHHGYIPRIRAGLKALGNGHDIFETRLIQFANLYRGKERIPMSTRQGQFVTLESLYTEVGVDASRYFYIMRRSDQHLDFDLELAKSQNNQNPVFYIQYAHARICSIFEKHGQYIPSILHLQQPSDIEIEILTALQEYTPTLIKTAQTCDVYRWAQYTYNMASLFHRYYNNTVILTESETERYHRLLICHLVSKCISNALGILNISAPRSM